MENLLTLEQVANQLNVCKATLREWDKSGELKAIKTPGGHRRYLQSDISNVLATYSNRPAPPRAQPETKQADIRSVVESARIFGLTSDDLPELTRELFKYFGKVNR